MPLLEPDSGPACAVSQALLRFLAENFDLGRLRADSGCIGRGTVPPDSHADEGQPLAGDFCPLFARALIECAVCPAEAVRHGGRRTEFTHGGEVSVLSRPPFAGAAGSVAEGAADYQRSHQDLVSRLAEARRYGEQLENILRSVGDGLVVTNGESRIVLLNPIAERFLGIRQTSFLHPTLAECIRNRKLLRRFLRASERRDRDSRFDVEGEEGSVWSVQVSPLRDEAGAAVGTVFLLRDITRERELDRMKSEFISTAAHELRTPLSTIMGFSELLMVDDTLTRAQIREYATFIHRKTENLERIISDLLDTSRIEAGRGIELTREVFDLTAVIREIALPFRRGSAPHHLEVDLPEAPVVLRADRGKIVQVLDNLLSNALKYSPKGGEIRISLSLLPGACQITVEDQGIGMTREQAERAFDRFWRGDSSNTAIGGTGLGLSIAKYIVEAHGGRIWLESRKNRGTTVFFLLPLLQREEGLPVGRQQGEGGDAEARPEDLSPPPPVREVAARSAP